MIINLPCPPLSELSLMPPLRMWESCCVVVNLLKHSQEVVTSLRILNVVLKISIGSQNRREDIFSGYDTAIRSMQHNMLENCLPFIYCSFSSFLFKLLKIQLTRKMQRSKQTKVKMDFQSGTAALYWYVRHRNQHLL